MFKLFLCMMCSLPHSLKARAFVPWMLSPWAGRQGWRADWSPMIQGNWSVSCWTPWTHIHPYGSRWDLSKGTEGAGGSAHWDIFCHLPGVLANQGSPNCLELRKCVAHLQKGWGGEGSTDLTSAWPGISWSSRFCWVPSCGMCRTPTPT